MAIAPICKLTDGTTTVNLLTGTFRLNSWPPKITQAKGGGTWQDSPLVEGRRLVTRVYGNVIEEYDLQVVAGIEDTMIREVQDFRRLLEKSVSFWTTDWQDEPVWLEVRGPNETNTRYATIYNWTTPQDEDPFGSIFTQTGEPGAVIMANWLLMIERSNWLGHPPQGGSTCVQLSGSGVYGDRTAANKSSDNPTAAADDARVCFTAATINTAALDSSYGVIAAQSYGSGTRYITVNVPVGAVIRYAFIEYVAEANRNGTVVQALIRGELDATPAAFSTFTNYISRLRTAASRAWSNVPAEIAGNAYQTPDISNIIQEIVDLPTWASGNDIVIFIEDNGSDNNAYRDPASFDSVANPPPTLEIGWYTAEDTMGRTATCDDEVFISNKHNEAQLTDIHHNSGAAWVGNLLAGNPPYALLPAVPAINDAIYFGIDTENARRCGPFGSLIFDLSQGAGTATGVWEYYNGGGWAALSLATDARDETGDGINTQLVNLGVTGIYWDQAVTAAGTWTPVSLFVLFGGVAPAVTGWWLRYRVTAIGGAPTAPTQQHRHVYTINWSNAELQAAQVVGDIPTLSKIKLFNHSSAARFITWGGVTELIAPYLMANRAFVATRSVARGDDFRLWLNTADVQNPDGMTIVLSNTAVTFADDGSTPTGRCILFNPAGVVALTDGFEMLLNGELAEAYYGTSKIFLRLRQVGGSGGDFTYRMRIETGTAGTIYRSAIMSVDPKPAVADEDLWLLIDLGRIDVVPPQLLADGEVFEDLRFVFEVGNSNAAPGDLRFMDLGFLPVDEWACDCEDCSNSEAASLMASPPDWRYLDIDSISNSRRQRRVLMRKNDIYESIVANWIYRSNSASLLQANAEQRIYAIFARYFESGSESFLDGNPNITSSIQAFSVPRYLAARGSR